MDKTIKRDKIGRRLALGQISAKKGNAIAAHSFS